MATFEIDHDEWKGFFDNFSRTHEGWLITVELLAERLGDQLEIENMRLRAISVEASGADRLEISVADAEEHERTHVIESPSHVWLKEEEAGDDAVLEIETPDATTLVHLRAATQADAPGE
jgi:hypothetical protein